MSSRYVQVETFINSQLDKYQNNHAIRYWPNYIYHFSDIRNIIEILSANTLYSRNKAVELELMKNDNASDNVIHNSSSELFDYVRFYFRPLTPTLYSIEGYIPIDKIENNAHCPFPIYLLFDSIKLLSMQDAYFSEKTMASILTEKTNSIEELMKFNFDKIYHIGAYSESEKSIKQYRQAEALIKDFVSLDNLMNIVCRSEAEKETLLYYIDFKKIDSKFKDKVIVLPRNRQYFNYMCLFIEEVEKTSTKITVTCNPTLSTTLAKSFKSPFSIKYEIFDEIEQKMHYYESNYRYNENKKLVVTLPCEMYFYTFSIIFENTVMHFSEYSSF